MQKIKGSVNEIFFEDKISSFAIFEFIPFGKETKESEKPAKFTAQGKISPLFKGVSFTLTGEFSNDAKGRPFFDFFNSELIYIPDIANLKKNAKKMLTSEPFNFTSSEANTIYNSLKEITFESILKNPQILKTIKGIDPNRVGEALLKIEGDKYLLKIGEFLNSFRIPASYAPRLYDFYKDETIEVLQKTPLLPGLQGAIPVPICRYLSHQLNYPLTSLDSLACIIIEALQYSEAKGNTYTEANELFQLISEKSKINDINAIIQALKYSQVNNFVQLQNLSGKFYIARSLTARSEKAIASSIERLSGNCKISFKLDAEIEFVENEIGIFFSEEQKKAIKTAFISNFSIITGPAGCGKTSVLGAITRIFRRNFSSGSILLCAPTGKAATRMTHSTGMSAFTVHHALNMRPVFEDDDSFDSQIQLNHDLIILDEGSMLDSDLAGVFFSGIKSGAKVIILGDPNQLPSVGCGNVLAEIIKSGKVPVSRLTSIYRQDGTSPIIYNANKIKDEMTDILFCPGFEFIPARNEEEAENIAINEFLRVLPAVGRENIALLTPYRRKTRIGCNNLNKILEPIINPEVRKVYSTGKASFKKGDVIIRTQNDNRQHICNGTIGVIADINSNGFMVDFGNGRTVFYGYPEFDNFDLAYANTIHKSQGSEYNTVILLIMPEHISMLSNSILYTGVTRARNRVIIIGNEETFKEAILRKTDIKRTTLLSYEIISVFNKNRH